MFEKRNYVNNKWLRFQRINLGLKCEMVIVVRVLAEPCSSHWFELLSSLARSELSQ